MYRGRRIASEYNYCRAHGREGHSDSFCNIRHDRRVQLNHPDMHPTIILGKEWISDFDQGISTFWPAVPTNILNMELSKLDPVLCNYIPGKVMFLDSKTMLPCYWLSPKCWTKLDLITLITWEQATTTTDNQQGCCLWSIILHHAN